MGQVLHGAPYIIDGVTTVNYLHGPIVQGIERKFPKLQIRVRVAVGLQDCLILFSWIYNDSAVIFDLIGNWRG